MLFNDSFEDSADAIEVTTEVVNTPDVDREKDSSRKRGGKNFISNIESIFTDSFSDQLNNKPIDLMNDSGAAHITKGLDSLVRSTLEDAEIEVSYDKRKRVTLFIEHANLDKLKAIADKEQKYFRDLVNTIFADYIAHYD